MRILALDLGSRTGWALGTRDRRRWIHGWWDIAPRRGESPGTRYIKLRGKLTQVLAAYRVAMIVYEQAHHRGGAATEYAAGCAAVVQEICAELGLEHAAVHSATLKKHAAGSGRANKDQMRTAALELVGPPIDNDDEADAICLLDYAIAEFS